MSTLHPGSPAPAVLFGGEDRDSVEAAYDRGEEPSGRIDFAR
jgi:hypothetical protein